MRPLRGHEGGTAGQANIAAAVAHTVRTCLVLDLELLWHVILASARRAQQKTTQPAIVLVPGSELFLAMLALGRSA